jgi:hypothetical protein
LISLLLVVIGVVAKYWIAPILSKPFASATTAKFVSSDSISARHLVATMWVDSVRIYSDTDIRIDLDFENHSSRTAELLSIELKTPGFEETGPCWQDHHPACLAEDKSSQAPMPADLQAGTSMHLYATLRSLDAGRYGILAIYRWAETDRDGGATTTGIAPDSYTRAVSLEPIEVTTRWMDSRPTWLAVPVVIALASAIWQLMIKRHDERYKERERAFQVWKEQLARVFEYTEQHYLPISRSIRGLQEAVTKERAGDAHYRERVFYYFLMFWMHMRNLRDKKGGWFLMTKEAEDILSDANYLLWNQFETKLDDKRLDTLIGLLKRPVSLAKYREACKPGSLLTYAETEFLAWMEGGPLYDDGGDSFKRCLSLMGLMRKILRFEWDRPFVEYWYLKKPDFDLAEFREKIENLPNVPPADKENVRLLERVQKKASTYADSVEAYLKV